MFPGKSEAIPLLTSTTTITVTIRPTHLPTATTMRETSPAQIRMISSAVHHIQQPVAIPTMTGTAVQTGTVAEQTGVPTGKSKICPHIWVSMPKYISF